MERTILFFRLPGIHFGVFSKIPIISFSLADVVFSSILKLLRLPSPSITNKTDISPCFAVIRFFEKLELNFFIPFLGTAATSKSFELYIILYSKVPCSIELGGSTAPSVILSLGFFEFTFLDSTLCP
ncbi:hypothetical protein D3C85_1023790 [compost metagenome]